jgi:tetratricopeptide (TPR) repeat protein
LLSAEEQRVLRRVMVFRGGFTRAAAEEVAGASLGLLSALVAKSLLRRATDGRYDSHELVRQYALLLLEQDEQEQADVRGRHCRYYADLLHQQVAALEGPDQIAVTAALRLDMANGRQAWDWASTHALAPQLSRAADTLFWLYEAQSNFREGVTLFEQAEFGLQTALESAAATPRPAYVQALGEVLSFQGFFRFRQGQHPLGREILQRSVALLAPIAEGGTRAGRAALSTALAFLGIVTYRMGAYAEGRDRLLEGLALKRELGDRWGMALCLRQLGLVAYSQGAYAEAHRLLSESLALSRAMGNPWSLAFSLNFLSRAAYAQGAYGEAQQLLQEGLALSRKLADRFNIASAQSGLGRVEQALGHGPAAQRCFEESIAIWREIGDQDSLAQSLNQLGEIFLCAGNWRAARDAFVEALAVAREAQVAPVMLDALLGVASLCTEQGALEAPFELVLHILEHPASTQAARAQAERLRAVLAQRLSRQQIEIMHTRARQTTLGELTTPEQIARLVNTLSRASD